MDLTDSDLHDIATNLNVDVTELQSDAVKDCAESVYEERDVSKSQAFAICQDMENQGQLQATHVALAELRAPGTIERIEQSDGSVRYKNVMLLAPGVWGDAASQRQFLYSEDTTQVLAENVQDTTLNLFHEQDNETTEVGDLDESSVFVGEDDGGLYGDLVLGLENPASEFADQALQDALESGGEKGIKGPSLEIAKPEHQFNADAGVPEVTDGVITGVALVGLGVSLGPGSEDVAFEEQTRARAVALSKSSAGGSHVLTRNYDMTEPASILQQLMASDVASESDVREFADEQGIELQDDDDEDEEDEEESEMQEDEDESEESEESSEETDEDDEEDTDVDIDLSDVAEQVNSMQEQVQSNAERIESLAEATGDVDLAELNESVQQLSESLEEKADAERVSELSETVESVSNTLEEPTSLASMGDQEGDGEGDGVGPLVEFGRTSIDKTS